MRIYGRMVNHQTTPTNYQGCVIRWFGWVRLNFGGKKGRMGRDRLKRCWVEGMG